MLGVVPLPRPDLPAHRPPQPARLLAVEPLRLQARDEIERYLDALNNASPVAERVIRGWSPQGHDWLGVSAVLHADAGGAQPTEVFIGEGQFSFDVEMATRNAAMAPDAYVVGLPVTGRMSVTIEGHETLAQAGEGVIVDPSRIERTSLSGSSHFVEFYLPRREMLRLAAEWAPGVEPHAPLFEPHLRAPLAQRLLFMATQAAELLQAPGPAEGKRMLFRRWIEMMGLCLLHEQPLAQSRNRRSAMIAPAPASLRRAVEFIHAHSDTAIGLTDIADAACVSVSSLLRQFNGHLGQSPVGFLRVVRLERARTELRGDGALPVREVALRWGFQNASKFTRAYQQQFGELPSETRGKR
jgi:AraC-like DNA-binding protein